MPKQNYGGARFQDVAAIDERLSELEQEKKQLLALREELQQSLPIHTHPNKRSRYSEACFVAALTSLLTVGRINKDEAVTQLPATTNGYRVFAINLA